MANVTYGVNQGSLNPYSVVVTNSGTLVGSDIELVINLSNVLDKETVQIALDVLKAFLVQAADVSQEGQGGSPP